LSSSDMLVKRYYAKNLKIAMETIIKELGADAVILSNRKVRAKGFFGFLKKRVMEVMVAYDPNKTPSALKLEEVRKTGPAYEARPRPADSRVAAAYAAASNTRPDYSAPADNATERAYALKTPAVNAEMTYAANAASEKYDYEKSANEAVILKNIGESLPRRADTAETNRLDGLDRRIDSIDSMLREFTEKFSFVKREVTYDYPEGISTLLRRMIDNQVRDELAHSIAKQTDTLIKRKAGVQAYEAMHYIILEQLGEPSPVTHKKFSRKVILLMGPTGAGKTTTIGKLAAEFAIKQRKKVGIINTDTYRIGAQEQLSTYAEIIGLPLMVVYKPEELRDALDAMADQDIIFIDTAGKSPGDMQHREDIGGIIKIAAPEEILLCVPASLSFASAKELLDAYAFAGDYKLLVTKLDETKYRGMILNMAWYSGKKLAYITNGQNVPDDIEVADSEIIVSQILGDTENNVSVHTDKLKV